MTSHCCQLIVKVKYIIINEYCLQYQTSHGDGRYGPYTSSRKFRKSLQKHLDYPDIGRVVYGKWGAGFVKMFLVLTQFGFCVNYHIFLGNTLYGMIEPSSLIVPADNNSSHPEVIPPHIDHKQYDNILQQSALNFTLTTMNHLGNSTVTPIDEVVTPKPESLSSSWTPPLSLLVICPLPLFLVFVLIRQVRGMAPISFIANSAATIAYFLLIGYISAGN